MENKENADVLASAFFTMARNYSGSRRLLEGFERTTKIIKKVVHKKLRWSYSGGDLQFWHMFQPMYGTQNQNKKPLLSHEKRFRL